MDVLKDYGPLALLLAWFGYKWWRSQRVVGMMPALRQQGAVLIDVRSAAEFAQASAPGTINIPLQEVGGRLAEVPKGVPVVVGCASGTRSGMAGVMLRKQGYAPVYNIGGWRNFLK